MKNVRDFTRAALAKMSIDEHFDMIAEAAQKEVRKLLRTQKFKNFLRALMWYELRNKLVNMEILNLVPKEKQEEIIEEVLRHVLKGIKK